MTPYDLYCFCRRMQQRNRPKYDTFEKSSEFGFMNMLHDHLQNSMELDDKEIRNYIKSNFIEKGNTFDIYQLMSSESNEIYKQWKNKLSTKSKYFSEVLNGISFIENFCIKKSINFDQYCYKYAMKHVREKRFDWSISVYCNFIDIYKLKRVEKILLKNYIDQYNIISNRLNNLELRTLISERVEDMKNLLNHMSENK